MNCNILILKYLYIFNLEHNVNRVEQRLCGQVSISVNYKRRFSFGMSTDLVVIHLGYVHFLLLTLYTATVL